MPGRLLLAAEIMLDVAQTMADADRPLLEAAAEELLAAAQALAAETGVRLEYSPELTRLLATAHEITLPSETDTGRTRR